MLKKYFTLILIFYLTVLSFIHHHHHFFLPFYVLYPVFLIPYFWTVKNPRHPLSILILVAIAGAYFAYLPKHFSLEYLFLGFAQMLFFAAIFYYERRWEMEYEKEEKERQAAFRDLRTFNHKFRSRLDSLKHLEKQVSGLLEL